MPCLLLLQVSNESVALDVPSASYHEHGRRIFAVYVCPQCVYAYSCIMSRLFHCEVERQRTCRCLHMRFRGVLQSHDRAEAPLCLAVPLRCVDKLCRLSAGLRIADASQRQALPSRCKAAPCFSMPWRRNSSPCLCDAVPCLCRAAPCQSVLRLAFAFAVPVRSPRHVAVPLLCFPVPMPS